MGPGPHGEKGSLCSHNAAAHHRQFRPVTIWGPPDQILDLPLIWQGASKVNMSIIGLQALYYCLCGDSYGMHGSAPESECDQVCLAGYGRCGASWRNNIYDTRPMAVANGTIV